MVTYINPMCDVTNCRLFVRSDDSHLITGKLPDIKVTPAKHMNFDGSASWQGTGYLSLFLYDSAQVTCPDGRNFAQAAAYAINVLLYAYVHFIFIPQAVAQVNLDNDLARQTPKTGRTPTLFNTSGCRPPARINEDREVVEYANRYIDEYLYTGSWAMGTSVITERKRQSALLALMSKRAPLEEICKYVAKHYPCEPPPDDKEGGGGSGSGSSSSSASGLICAK